MGVGMWTLVLVLLGTNPGSGAAITVAPGAFTSEASCMVAARQFVEGAKGGYQTPKAFCFKRDL